ncbi:MAG TPA: hypothetical protein VNQ77_00660 [Frankiaceae bacterium]|nr:hypothetical protein [Frankiaceae bacterium]
MRKLLAVAAALALSAAPSSSGSPGPGYLDKTSNVEFVANIPLDADTAGARLLGKKFYVLTAKGLTIYDVSNPTLPLPMGFTPLPHTPNQEREDVDTNGKILVAGQSYTGILYVVDVSNPNVPTLISTLRGAAGHTNTCVLSCKWVYSSDGEIVDLRDPKNPKLAGSWRGVGGVTGSHDWTEVSPGLLVGATSPVVYLDARKNPAKPKLIASGRLPDSRYVHGNVWPRGGKDRFLLVGSESGMMCGDPKDGSFMVYDTKNHAKTKSFKYLGDYSLTPGLFTEGRAEVNQHCGHWFQPHPSFKDGGLVAVAWYGFGTRFVEVTKTGKIVEKGWFLGGGAASSAYWISPDVVYSLDYVRGIDIIKFDRKAKPTSSGNGQWNPVSPFAAFLDREPARNGKPYVCPLPL